MNQLLIQLLRSTVYYILLIAEKNKEVCYLTSDLFHFIFKFNQNKNVILFVYLSLSLSVKIL